MASDHPPAAEKRGLYGQRPSASADAARRAEFARIWMMPARARVALALELGRRLRIARVATDDG